MSPGLLATGALLTVAFVGLQVWAHLYIRRSRDLYDAHPEKRLPRKASALRIAPWCALCALGMGWGVVSGNGPLVLYGALGTLAFAYMLWKVARVPT